MKEIIYLDKTMLDSYLAQLHSGLTNKLSTTTQMDLTESETISSTITFSAGMFSIKFGANNQDNNSTAYTKRNAESYEIAYHDYALDVLLGALNSSDNQLIQDSNYIEGNFILPEGKIVLYDFKSLEQSLNSGAGDLLYPKKEIVNKIDSITQSPEYEKNKDTLASKIDKQQSKLKKYQRNAKLANALFPESCLVKISNFVCICPKENFRINEATLSLFNETKRNFKCLAVILFQRNPVNSQRKTVFSIAPTKVIDAIIKDTKEYYVVRPLAIYYDND